MIQRSPLNPIIRPVDVKPSTEGFKVVGAFNPGAVAFNDEILLLIRVSESCIPVEGKIRFPSFDFNNGKGTPKVIELDENDPDIYLKDTRGLVYQGTDFLTSVSHIRLARSKDGVNFTVDDTPFLSPSSPEEKYGIEDARVVHLDGRWYINYTIVSEDSWSTALSVTDDFQSVERLGIIFHPENKDVAIFPETINGKYAALHRPSNNGFGKPSIWYAESPDLVHWGKHRCIARPRSIPQESLKIGGGSAPIKTEDGWLVIYHAKDNITRGTLFAMLLDLEKPWNIRKRGRLPLLEPEDDYETSGFFSNVVFSNGALLRDNELYIYYGASDEYSCLATIPLQEVLTALKSCLE